MEILFKRRSIRKYLDKPIEDEKIKTIIEAGMYAPSAKNQQPWHFIVIKDRNVLDSIREVHEYSKMLEEAPLAIIVVGNLVDLKLEEMWTYDCSAATQNILLAATGLGLGSVWLGLKANNPNDSVVKQIGEILGLPENKIPCFF